VYYLYRRTSVARVSARPSESDVNCATFTKHLKRRLDGEIFSRRVRDLPSIPRECTAAQKL